MWQSAEGARHDWIVVGVATAQLLCRSSSFYRRCFGSSIINVVVIVIIRIYIYIYRERESVELFTWLTCTILFAGNMLRSVLLPTAARFAASSSRSVRRASPRFFSSDSQETFATHTEISSEHNKDIIWSDALISKGLFDVKRGVLSWGASVLSSAYSTKKYGVTKRPPLTTYTHTARAYAANFQNNANSFSMPDTVGRPCGLQVCPDPVSRRSEPRSRRSSWKWAFARIVWTETTSALD